MSTTEAECLPSGKRLVSPRPTPSRKDAVATQQAAEPPSWETWNARDVVVAYVEARCRAGLSTDQRTRAILGKYARKLNQAGGWDRATVIEATERFATSRRHVRFFEEWVATVFNADQLAEHNTRKAEEAEFAKTTRGLRGIAAILGQPAGPHQGEDGNAHLSNGRTHA